MTSFSSRLSRLSGFSLCLTGILLFLINVIFTPRILAIDDFAESAASSAWAWRLGLACFVALLLIIGSVGIFEHFEQRKPGRVASLFTLMVLLSGNALLLAHEWNQWLFVRDLAIHIPDALNQLEDTDGFTLFDLSALIGTSAFFLSWILAAVLLWMNGIIKKHIAILMIAGLVSSPILSVFSLYVIAIIISTFLLGLGWFLLGLQLLKGSITPQ